MTIFTHATSIYLSIPSRKTSALSPVIMTNYLLPVWIVLHSFCWTVIVYYQMLLNLNDAQKKDGFFFFLATFNSGQVPLCDSGDKASHTTQIQYKTKRTVYLSTATSTSSVKLSEKTSVINSRTLALGLCKCTTCIQYKTHNRGYVCSSKND